MSRVLVLGGAGFIGYHLARHLADEGASAITLVDDLSRGRLDEDLSALLGRPWVELVRADLTDPGAWARLGGRWDQTYMLVAVVGVRPGACPTSSGGSTTSTGAGWGWPTSSPSSACGPSRGRIRSRSTGSSSAGRSAMSPTPSKQSRG